MSDYLAFRQIKDTGKTQVFSVDSKHHGDRLALIKWYGPWRQYALWPEAGTIWNTGCLEDVSAFTRQLMQSRAAQREEAQDGH